MVPPEQLQKECIIMVCCYKNHEYNLSAVVVHVGGYAGVVLCKLVIIVGTLHLQTPHYIPSSYYVHIHA